MATGAAGPPAMLTGVPGTCRERRLLTLLPSARCSLQNVSEEKTVRSRGRRTPQRACAKAAWALNRRSVTIRPYRESDEAAVVALWRECGLTRPQNDPRKDIGRKLQVSPEWFLVGEEDGRVVATAMVGYEGHRGWINYLAVVPSRQRAGCGRALMDEAERRLRAVGCAKINLQVRGGNAAAMAFYRRIGFAVDDVVSFGKRLEVD